MSKQQFNERSTKELARELGRSPLLVKIGRLKATLKNDANPNDPAVIDRLATFAKGAPFRYEVLDLLFDHGLDANARSTLGRSLFDIVRGQGDDADVLKLLARSREPVDLLAYAQDIYPPIIRSVLLLKTGTLQVIQDHFEQRIMPANAEREALDRNHMWLQREADGCTAVMNVVDQLEKLKWIMSHPDLGMKGHMEDRDKLGRTMLRIALDGECTDSVQYLLSLGASTEARDNKGVSVFEAARDNDSAVDDAGTAYDKGVMREHISAAHAYRAAARAIEDVIEKSMSRVSP